VARTPAERRAGQKNSAVSPKNAPLPSVASTMEESSLDVICTIRSHPPTPQGAHAPTSRRQHSLVLFSVFAQAMARCERRWRRPSSCRSVVLGRKKAKNVAITVTFGKKEPSRARGCSFSSLQRVCLTKVREWKIAILAQEWDDLKPDSEMLCDVVSGGNPTGPRAQQVSMSQSGCLAQVKPLFCVRRS